MKADPVALLKDSVPVTHFVNLWLQPSGCLHLGDRHNSLADARNKTNGNEKRLCILKITTMVEVA